MYEYNFMFSMYYVYTNPVAPGALPTCSLSARVLAGLGGPVSLSSLSSDRLPRSSALNRLTGAELLQLLPLPPPRSASPRPPHQPPPLPCSPPSSSDTELRPRRPLNVLLV